MSVTLAAQPYADLSALHSIIPAIAGRRRRKVLAVMNGKGGVGKSSLAAALAVDMTRMGKRVLLAEADPQGNNAEDLGIITSEIYDQGKAQARAIISGNGFTPTGEARPGLFVVPGGEALEDVVEELSVQSRIARHTDDPAWLYMYAGAIAAVEDAYDLIILDVAPGSKVLQMQAMVAADMVIVPSRSDQSSRKGLRTIARRYREAKPYNPGLELIGIVLFGVTSRGRQITKSIRDDLISDVRGAAPVLDTVIRYLEAPAVQCRRLGLVPHELARDESIPASTVKSAKGLASDYRSLAMEILTIIAGLHQRDAGLQQQDAG